jgi:peptidoglycan/LPS O-acetylase OafA/YrhL
MNNHYDYYYKQTYCRLPSYLIGILLGWILYNKKKNQVHIKLNKMIVAFGWIISLTCGFIVLHGLAPFFDEDSFYSGYPEFSSFVRISYGAFHRTVFAMAIAWVIFACTNQYGGFINRFLSMKVFLPLSRLCYAAYLVNFNLVRVYTANQRQPSYFNESELLMTIQGFLLSVFLLSFVVSLVVEMPFINLSKLLFDELRNNERRVTAADEDHKKAEEQQEQIKMDLHFDNEATKKLQDPSLSRTLV